MHMNLSELRDSERQGSLACCNTWRCKETLMLGEIEGRRRREGQRMRWLDGIIDSVDMSSNKFLEMVKDREAWHAAVHGVTKNWTQLIN